MITASIVSYKSSPEDINKIIDCVLGNNVSLVYVVDNASDDALAASTACRRNVVYIPNDNKGYGYGHNVALRKAMDAGADYHAVVNPDIYFEAGVLDRLAAYMDANPDVGLVMPDVLYPDGERQYLCKLLPSPADFIARRFLDGSVMKNKREHFEMRFSGYDKEMNVPFLSGCFMFLRVETLRQVGIFDERYFMYCEDTDLSRRIHARYKTVFYPKEQVIHAHAAASHKNIRMLMVHIKSTVSYFNKWGWFFDKERKRINKEAMKPFEK